nr:hypothetical protein BCU55_19235 [Shewanella sp. 10N.286.48.A6]
MQPLDCNKFTIQAVKALTLLAMCLMVLTVSKISLAQDMNPVIAWEKINKGAMILDVRTAEEFAAGHLEGAINIPFNIALKELNKQNIAKDTAIVLYCRSGRRSGIANDELAAAGYTQTYNGGGIATLSANKQ